jgi:chaperonin cofactor prefoldin
MATPHGIQPYMAPSPEQEKEFLEQQRNFIADQIETIKKRLEELKKGE